MKRYLLNDQGRCDNEVCSQKLNCKRYMQLQIDTTKEKPDAVWVSTFNADNCQAYLPINSND
jgi:hypothetical protein